MAKHIFRPNEYISSVQEVDYERLLDLGIRGLLFDIDNTLATYDTPDPGEDIRELFDGLRKMGFRLGIISNGRRERVTAFGEKLGAAGVWKAGKPFGSGFRRAKKNMDLESAQIAILGDQIFTDVWGGNVAHFYTILIKPISEERDEWVTKPKRWLEKRILDRYRLRPRGKRRGKKGSRALMKVDGSTQILGVMGDPVAQTMSPFIHSLMIQERGDNFLYMPIRVRREDLEAAMSGAWAMNIRGLNVTVPHKKSIIPLLEGLDESARLVGAVNVLKRTETGFRGYNTDVDGFRFMLKENRAEIAGRKVLILGAGGAARAALAGCWLEKAGEVVICNRTRAHAEKMAEEFAGTVGADFPLRVIGEEELGEEIFPVVIQATSAGLYPDTERLPVENDEFYLGIRLGLDLIYNPAETAFCRKVKEGGGAAGSGLPMLFYQAVKAYEIWTDKAFTQKEVEYLQARFGILAEEKLGKK